MSAQEYPVSPECVVCIESTACDITVTGAGQLQVVIETQNQDECHVVRHENRLQIIANPQRVDNLAVMVPAGCTLEVSSFSGDLTVSQLADEVTLKTMSGDVAAQQISGHLHIETVSGDVAIAVSAISGLAVETVSGDISVESELAPEGEYSLHTISGDLRVMLDEGQRCTLRYQSLSGDFSCILPHDLRREGWGKMEVAINGGGVAMECVTTSGDLTIRPARIIKKESAPEQPVTRVKETRPLTEPFALNQDKLAQAVPPAGQLTRMEVLKAIEEGSLSVPEGLARLQALDT